MRKAKLQQTKRLRRARRVRASVRGTATRPRLSVFRSNRGIYAQLIDDGKDKTVAAASSRGSSVPRGVGIERARFVGELIAKRALEQGIKEAVLDRGSYRYHGQVRALAEGARSAGLKL